MRQPLRANAARRARSRPLIMPAPVKGWLPNLPITGLPADGAALLDNWFPEADGVRPRKGSRLHAQGLGPAPVESLFAFTGAGSARMFAAAGGSIFDVTDPASPGSVITGTASARWQTINMATSGGASLLGFNGADLPFRYDGRNFSNAAYTAAAGDAAVNPRLIVQGCTYAARLFLVSAGLTVVLYTAPDTFQGQVGRLEVGASFPRGGTVQAVERWTQDAGQGPRDHLVILSSEGDIVVYAGTNPSDASAWDLVGTYQTAKPIGRRCMARLGGDVAILTVDGVKKMSRIITQDSGVKETKDPFYAVGTVVRDRAARSADQFGWGLFTHRERSMFLVNAPRVAGASADQYVMNIGTLAWGRFTGLPATCFLSFGGELYFGTGAGRVMKAETGYGDLGQPTFCPLITGFTAAGSAGAIKQAKLIRSILITNGSPAPLVGVCLDYRLALPVSGPAPAQDDVARFDAARFDVSRWASGRFGAPHQEWSDAEGVGFAFAAALALSLGPEVPDVMTTKLVGFHLLAEPGSGLL